MKPLAAYLRKAESFLEASAGGSLICEAAVLRERLISNAVRNIFLDSSVTASVLRIAAGAIFYAGRAVSAAAGDLYNGSNIMKAIERAALNSRWIR